VIVALQGCVIVPLRARLRDNHGYIRNYEIYYVLLLYCSSSSRLAVAVGTSSFYYGGFTNGFLPVDFRSSKDFLAVEVNRERKSDYCDLSFLLALATKILPISQQKKVFLKVLTQLLLKVDMTLHCTQ
jgi:hypothetical protein